MSKFSKILFYIGDVVLFLIGAFHLLGHFTSSPIGANDNQRKFLELFSTTPFEMPSGEMRTYLDIYNAFSLYFGVFAIGMAGVIWFSSKDSAILKRSLIFSSVIMLVTAFITFKYAILPPLVMMLVVTICFGLSAILMEKESSKN